MTPVLPVWAAKVLHWSKLVAAVVVPILVAFGVTEQTAVGLETEFSELILDAVPIAGAILVSVMSIYHQLKGSPPQS